MNFEISSTEIFLSIMTAGIVVIILILEYNKSLKARINILIGLTYILVILLIINAYMLYPQYKNNLDIQNTIQKINSSLENQDGSQSRTHGGQ